MSSTVNPVQNLGQPDDEDSRALDFANAFASISGSLVLT